MAGRWVSFVQSRRHRVWNALWRVTGTWLATPVAFYLVEDKTFSAGRILWKDLAGVRVARRRIVSVFLEITMTDGTQMRLGTSRTGSKRFLAAFDTALK